MIVEQEGDGPKTGVVILRENDGPPNVMILEGDELDDLDLDLDLHEPGKHAGKARMSLKLGGEGFDFTFDGPPDPEKMKAIQEKIRAHLKKAGIDKDIRLPMMFDPAKRAEWAKKAKERRAKMLAKMQARQRDRLLKELKVDAEEAAVLGPLLDKVLTERRSLKQREAKARRTLRKDSKAAADKATAEKIVKAFRDRKAQDGAALAKAREELRGLLTIRQEAILVGRGLLD